MEKAPALWSKSTNAVKWHMPSVDVRNVQTVANVGLANCNCVFKGSCESKVWHISRIRNWRNQLLAKVEIVDLQLLKTKRGYCSAEIRGKCRDASS